MFLRNVGSQIITRCPHIPETSFYTPEHFYVNKTMFRELDLFPSSGERRETASLIDPMSYRLQLYAHLIPGQVANNGRISSRKSNEACTYVDLQLYNTVPLCMIHHNFYRIFSPHLPSTQKFSPFPGAYMARVI
jgi:hypothetical protein